MIQLPDPENINRIADWIELSVLKENESYSKSKIIALIREAGEEPDESKIDSAFSELVRRLFLYGDVAPFRIERNAVIPVIGWDFLPEYVLCLIFSLFGVQDVADGGTKLFERVSNDILKFYLNGEAVTFGFPSTMNLKAQIQWIADSCYEKVGGLQPSPNDKDRGVDVIGWKPFNDQRNSQIIVLLQCAAGANWRTKKPVPLPSWASFISWNYSMTLPGLSITQVIEIDKWTNAHFDYGLVIDRARIYNLLSNPGFVPDNDLRREVTDWCSSKLFT